MQGWRGLRAGSGARACRWAACEMRRWPLLSKPKPKPAATALSPHLVRVVALECQLPLGHLVTQRGNRHQLTIPILRCSGPSHHIRGPATHFRSPQAPGAYNLPWSPISSPQLSAQLTTSPSGPTCSLGKVSTKTTLLCAAKNALVTSTSNTWPSHALAANFLHQR